MTCSETEPSVPSILATAGATKGAETIVSVTIEARGEKMELTLRHSGLPDDESGRQHKDGWTWILSRFAEALGRRRLPPRSDSLPGGRSSALE